MATTEKKLFRHGGSWAVDLPMQFAKAVRDMNVIIEASPDEIRITPKTELDGIEADPLFPQFFEALAIDAMKHPEVLHTPEAVWDEGWKEILAGVDVEEE